MCLMENYYKSLAKYFVPYTRKFATTTSRKQHLSTNLLNCTKKESYPLANFIIPHQQTQLQYPLQIAYQYIIVTAISLLSSKWAIMALYSIALRNSGVWKGIAQIPSKAFCATTEKQKRRWIGFCTVQKPGNPPSSRPMCQKNLKTQEKK